MIVCFLEQTEGSNVRYIGQSYLKTHVQSCEEAKSNIPQEKWVHNFINTLDRKPINWYLQEKLWLNTVYWHGMTQKFIATFLFESQYPVGHYNCLINSNNQVLHELSTQGSLFISKITMHYICSIPKAT
jgi:hypothetical protein